MALSRDSLLQMMPCIYIRQFKEVSDEKSKFEKFFSEKVNGCIIVSIKTAIFGENTQGECRCPLFTAEWAYDNYSESFLSTIWEYCELNGIVLVDVFSFHSNKFKALVNIKVKDADNKEECFPEMAT